MTRTVYHEEDNKIIVEHRDDLEPYLKRAHERRANTSKHQNKGDWHLAMSLPPVAIIRIMDQTGLNFFDPQHWPEFVKILRTDPYYQAFRTSERNI